MRRGKYAERRLCVCVVCSHGPRADWDLGCVTAPRRAKKGGRPGGRQRQSVCMPKYVCIMRKHPPAPTRPASWAHSRVVGGEGLGGLAVPLDGLHGGGVEHSLSHRSLSVSSALLVGIPPVPLVQDVHAQQQTVVHDLKTLQHLKCKKTKTAFTNCLWGCELRRSHFGRELVFCVCLFFGVRHFCCQTPSHAACTRRSLFEAVWS